MGKEKEEDRGLTASWWSDLGPAGGQTLSGSSILNQSTKYTISELHASEWTNMFEMHLAMKQQSMKRKVSLFPAITLSWMTSWRSATSCLQISIRALSPWLWKLACQIRLSPRLSGHLSGRTTDGGEGGRGEEAGDGEICWISAFHLSSTCSPDSTMPRGEELEKTKDYSEKKSAGKPEGESVSFQFISLLSVVKLSTS